LEIKVEKVGSRGDAAELAEHGHDLAPVQGSVVDEVEDHLPSGDGEGVSVETPGGEVAVEVGFGVDVDFEGVDYGRPVLFELFEVGAGSGVGEVDNAAFEAGEPNSISVVDMLQGGENGGVGDLQISFQLLRGEARRGVEKLGGGPKGVFEMGKKGGSGFHKKKSRD